MLITCLSVQISVALVGATVNAILMYSLIKSTLPFVRRTLFINVTIAALFSTLIHCVQGCYQVKKLMTTGNGELEGDEKWSDFVADIAQTAVFFGVLVLAFVNLFFLYRCTRECASGHKKVQTHTGIVALVMILCVWIVDVGFVSAGMNPQSQINNGGKNFISYASLVVGISIELSVSSAVFVTIRLLNRLKVDFEIRQAQQKLDLRVHIKRTITLTAIIYRILILHSLIWITAVVVGFALNRFINSVDRFGSDNDPNRVAAYISLVDLIELCYDSIFPLVVMRKEPGLQLGFLRCGAEKPQKIKPNVNTPRKDEVRIHFNNLSSHWNRVATIKFKSNPSKGPGKSTRTTRSTVSKLR